MTEWKLYRKKTVTELRPYVEGEPLTHVSGVLNPKPGDWIARDPTNHDDQWFVTKEYFEENYEDDTPSIAQG
jgi:hypothetical protein